MNIPKSIEKQELDNDYLIRRKAIDCNVPLLTNTQLAMRFIEAIYRTSIQDLSVKSWDEYLKKSDQLFGSPALPNGIVIS